MEKIPENFRILFISFDDIYDNGAMEALLINQAGLPHSALIDLEDLLKNPEEKIDLVIYIDRSAELGMNLKDFRQSFKGLKKKIKGIPTLKIKILEGVEKSILRVRNFPYDNQLQRIISFLTDHLNKMYKFS